MSNIVKIKETEILIKEYKGQRVVTSWDIAKVHKREVNDITKNFNNNKSKFIINEDYFLVSREEISEQKILIPEFIPNNVKEVNYGMLLSALAIFGVAAICCIALIGHLNETWDAGVPALVLANSIHSLFGLMYAVIIFLGIYSSACPLLWTSITHISHDGNNSYKIWSIALGFLGCAIACFVPYRPLLNIIYGLNGYLGFIFILCARCRIASS